MKTVVIAIALALSTEALLLVLGSHGVWQEDFPGSLGSALWFLPHLPFILLLQPLGLGYPPTPSGMKVLFALNAALTTGIYYLVLRAWSRRTKPDVNENMA